MANGANEVRVEKTFKQSPQTVFKALSEGRLFNNCGASLQTMEIDFRIGGQYKIVFSGPGMVGRGKFLEIVPDRKIIFTWGDEGSDEGFPKNTRVTMELFSESGKTRLTIHHTGFTTKEEADQHNEGWTCGLNDLVAEIETGRIRLVRVYPISRQKLYEACSDMRTFLRAVTDPSRGEVDFRVGGQYRLPTEKGGHVRGKYEEIVPGKKIVFTWDENCSGKLPNSTRVTLEFDDEEDGESSLVLMHELLPQEEVRGHREGWEFVTGSLKEALQR